MSRALDSTGQGIPTKRAIVCVLGTFANTADPQVIVALAAESVRKRSCEQIQRIRRGEDSPIFIQKFEHCVQVGVTRLEWRDLNSEGSDADFDGKDVLIAWTADDATFGKCAVFQRELSRTTRALE